MEIWRSQTARQIRQSIRDKECYCTNEIFMWPSIVFQPAQLAKSMIGAKVWQRAEPLPASERVDYTAAAAPLEQPAAAAHEHEDDALEVADRPQVRIVPLTRAPSA